MTIELTHEQAAILRCVENQCIVNAGRIDDYDTAALLSSACDDYGEISGLSKEAKEALAAYHAKWSIIETVELERLLDLEKTHPSHTLGEALKAIKDGIKE